MPGESTPPVAPRGHTPSSVEPSGALRSMLSSFVAKRVAGQPFAPPFGLALWSWSDFVAEIGAQFADSDSS
jgi:hypothetical protein